MADQTITATVAAQNGSIVETAGASLTAANPGVITIPKDRKVTLRATVSAAGGAVITVKAGTDAYKSGQGDFATASLAQNVVHIIGPLESARFKAVSGADIGKIRITVSDAVTVTALVTP